MEDDMWEAFQLKPHKKKRSMIYRRKWSAEVFCC